MASILFDETFGEIDKALWTDVYSLMFLRFNWNLSSQRTTAFQFEGAIALMNTKEWLFYYTF
jgi:hypothetical protein